MPSSADMSGNEGEEMEDATGLEISIMRITITTVCCMAYLMKVNRLTTKVTTQRLFLLQFLGFSGSFGPSHWTIVSPSASVFGVGEGEVDDEDVFSLRIELEDACFSRS